MGCVMSPFDIFQFASTWPFWEPSSSSPPSPSGWAKGLLRRNHLQQCCSNWTGVRKSCFKLFLTAQNYAFPQEQLFYASLSDTQLNCTFILLASFHLTITLCHKNFQALILTFLLNSCHQILCDVAQKGCYAECRDSSNRWTDFEHDLSSSCHYKKNVNHNNHAENICLNSLLWI